MILEARSDERLVANATSFNNHEAGIREGPSYLKIKLSEDGYEKL